VVDCDNAKADRDGPGLFNFAAFRKHRDFSKIEWPFPDFVG
jgi:hypothetical protein